MKRVHDHASVFDLRDKPARRREAVRVTVIGAVVNLALSVAKFIAGILGSSSAMIADAVHSLSDLVTDIIVYVSAKIASIDADENHPYGHGRAETIGTTAVGGALMLVGVFVAFEVIEKLVAGNFGVPSWPAIAGAVVSVVSKEILYRYTAHVGSRIKNEAIIANAWHHRSDAFSSVAALVGIGGAMLGFPLLDPLAAIVVVFMIVKIGWDIAWKAVGELMDTSLPSEKLKEIKDVIVSTEGVLRYHDLRARKLGADIFVDAHILVQPTISVSEAHNIAESARYNLIEKSRVADALIHIDAEEDMDYKLMLVNRETVEKIIKTETAKIDGLKDISEIIIHYLKKRVCIEFDVDIEDSMTIAEAKTSMAKLRETLTNDKMIDTVVIRGKFTKGIMESDFLE